MSSIEEDPLAAHDPEHKQNWNVTTKPEESWAVKERRRSSMWSKAEMPANLLSPKKTGGPRRGSVLSVWKSGKDKDGNDILVHDGSSEDEDDEEAIKDDKSQDGVELTKTISGTGSKGQDRRGSILSLWSGGKDANGRAIIMHDDEEWKD